jgi:hypothetical protein
MKFLFPAEGLPVAGTVVGHSSHGLRSQITLKLRPYVTFGSEMKWVKRALRTMVNTITCFKKYRKILFDETLYGYIAIPYFKK